MMMEVETMHGIRSIRSLVFALLMLVISAGLEAQIGVSITIPPPALPVYEQPICPAVGYMWTPGYWAYGDDGYYWVPGTWVEVPAVGLLWTPGYWGWNNGFYLWNAGYWGPQVGFYGGINYGFGYTGEGYEGGYWNNGQFYYNRTVNNVNTTTITNVYNKTVVNNTTVNNVSYNGGPAGTTARPTAQEEAAARQKHVPATATQVQHEQAAKADRNQLASANHGQPPVAATPKPGALTGGEVVKASRAGAPYNPAAETVSRPPAANQAPRPESNRPYNTAPRSEAPQGATPATRPEVPHPRAASEPQSAPRMENQPREQNMPHPENQPRPENPHPETAPHPEQAHPQAAPHPEQTHPEVTPHPDKEPRPEQERLPQ
jgi:hypothetical protein